MAVARLILQRFLQVEKGTFHNGSQLSVVIHSGQLFPGIPMQMKLQRPVYQGRPGAVVRQDIFTVKAFISLLKTGEYSIL